MDLLQNPFLILGATPRDNRRRIMALADEQGLLLDSNECIQARSELTNPRKRLSLEIAWLPGVGPKKAEELLNTLKTSPGSLLNSGAVTPATRANLLAAGLSRITSSSPELISKWIFALGLAFDEITPAELCAVINEERVVSGFPEVTDLSSVGAEIQERRRHYRQIIKSVLDKLSASELVKTVTMAVDSATNEGEEHGPILIADLADTYEVEAQDFLDKEEANIETLVAKLRTAVDSERSDSILAPMVNQLIQIVQNWDTVAQPIQVSSKSRGLDHDASHRVARVVRDLAIHMFNEHEKLDFSQQLTNMLQEVFAEVGEVAERVAEDADALSEIAEKRGRMIEDVKKNEDEWRREITYEAEIGVLFKDKLRISPEGIEWKGRRWALPSVTRIRWGGTRRSINGIPSGTTYSIFIGDKSDHSFIELKKESVYSGFIDRLWRAVGVRLLTEYLQGLRDGEKYRFGSAVMSDHGMELERKKMFSGNERLFCPWSELVVWDNPGVFCIGKKDDKKLAASFSYQEQDNIHVLEAAVRMFWKRGGKQISSLLEGE